MLASLFLFIFVILLKWGKKAEHNLFKCLSYVRKRKKVRLVAQSRYRKKRKHLFRRHEIVPSQSLQHSFLMSFERRKCFLKIYFFFCLSFVKQTVF